MKKDTLLAFLTSAAFVVGLAWLAIDSGAIKKTEAAVVIPEDVTVEVVFEEEPEVETVTEPETVYFDVPLSEDVQDHIFAECEKHGINPEIVVAMCFRESSYNANAIGDNGKSFGLMQIQARYHKERMERLGCTDLLDAKQNITVGVDFLAELLERYGDIEKALTAYNRGSYAGTVTQYAKAVMKKCHTLTTR